MGQDFLTLEGREDRRNRKRKTRPSILGALSAGESMGSGAENRRSGTVALGYDPRPLAPRYGQTYAFQAAQKKQERTRAFEDIAYGNWPNIKASNLQSRANMKFKTDELVAPAYTPSEGKMEAPDLFQSYAEDAINGYLACELAGYNGDGLDGFFSSFTKSFKPIAKVWDKAVAVVRPSRFLPPGKAGRAIRTGLRFYGAAMTMPMLMSAGKMRNQMFGLKGKEMVVFDKFAKSGRIVAALFGAKYFIGKYAGSVAIKGVASKGASTGFFGWLKTKAGMMFTAKAGSTVLLKDTAKGGIWKFVSSKLDTPLGKIIAGQVIGSFMPKEKVDPVAYNTMPDNTVVPRPVAGGGYGSPPTPAGASVPPGAEEGSTSEEQPEAVEAQAEADITSGDSMPFPHVDAQDPEANAHTLDPQYQNVDFDEASPSELVAQANVEQEVIDTTAEADADSDEENPDLSPSDSLSPEDQPAQALEEDFDEAFRLVKARAIERVKANAKNVNARRRQFAASRESSKFREPYF